MSDFVQPTYNPMQAFQQGFGTGAGIKQQELQTQAMEAANQQAILDQEKQMQITQMYDKLRSPNVTAQDYLNLQTLLPEAQAKTVRESMGLYNEEKAKKELKRTGSIFAAFKTGHPDMAIELIKNEQRALENAGNTQAAGLMGKWAEIAKTPEGAIQAMDYFATITGMIPGGGEFLDSAIEMSGERRTEELHPGVMKQQILDAGYTEAQTNKLLVDAKKIDNEIQKDLDKNKGILTLEDAEKHQDKIRSEFLKETTTARDAATKVNKIGVLADRAISLSEKTDDKVALGAADLGIINVYQRLIDEGVVKGEDVKLQSETGGGMTTFLNVAQKVRNGGLLMNHQREEFKTVSKLLLEQENKAIMTVRDIYTGKINKLGLDANSIFGEDYANLSVEGGTPTKGAVVAETPAKEVEVVEFTGSPDQVAVKNYFLNNYKNVSKESLEKNLQKFIDANPEAYQEYLNSIKPKTTEDTNKVITGSFGS